MRKYFIGISKSHIADLELRFLFIKIVLETLCHKLLYILYLLYFLAFVYILFGLVKNFRLVCRKTTTGKNFQLEQNLLYLSNCSPIDLAQFITHFQITMASFPCIKQRKHTEKCIINSSQVHAKAHSVTAATAGGEGGEAAPPARLDHINPANPNTFPFCLVLSIPPTRATFQRSQPDDMCVCDMCVCLCVCDTVSLCVCLCLSLARTRSKTFEAQHVALFHFVAYPFSARAQLRSCFQLVTVLASAPPPNPFTADCHGQTLSGLRSVFCGCCLHYVILIAAFSYSCYFSCCAWFSVLAAITLFSFCLATG